MNFCLLIPLYIKKLHKPKYVLKIVYWSKYDNTLYAYSWLCTLSSENKRRTKHISRTLNPEWHQKVTFQDVHHEEVKYKTLEITVWDYDRFKANDFLGEVVIDLSGRGRIQIAFIYFEKCSILSFGLKKKYLMGSCHPFVW